MTKCSLEPQASETIIGSPAAVASWTITPHGSNVLGKTSAEAFKNKLLISFGWIKPLF